MRLLDIPFSVLTLLLHLVKAPNRLGREVGKRGTRCPVHFQAPN